MTVIPDRLVEAGAQGLADWWFGRGESDGTPDGEDREMSYAVLEAVAHGSGAKGLMDVARLILEENYPADIFGETYREGADPGVKLVQALRECDAAFAHAATNKDSSR